MEFWETRLKPVFEIRFVCQTATKPSPNSIWDEFWLDTGIHPPQNLAPVSRVELYRVTVLCRSQWPRGLRRGSAAARLLRLWVRIPPGAWMSVCCECCVCCQVEVSATSCITRPEESYRLWCVVVCGLETSRMRSPWSALGRSATKKIVFMQLCFGITWISLTISQKGPECFGV